MNCCFLCNFQLQLADNDDATPVNLISNSALHLSGPARTVGGVVCGFTGIRTFEPQVRGCDACLSLVCTVSFACGMQTFISISSCTSTVHVLYVHWCTVAIVRWVILIDGYRL